MKRDTLRYIIEKLRELMIKESFEEKKRGEECVSRSVAYRDVIEVLERIERGEYE